jgi:hypothetical protein
MQRLFPQLFTNVNAARSLGRMGDKRNQAQSPRQTWTLRPSLGAGTGVVVTMGEQWVRDHVNDEMVRTAIAVERGEQELHRRDSMIGRRDLVSHFDATTVDGSHVRYADLWQHRNLVFVSVGTSDRQAQNYTRALQAHAAKFAAGTSLVISKKQVERLSSFLLRPLLTKLTRA